VNFAPAATLAGAVTEAVTLPIVIGRDAMTLSSFPRK
jgi:hypothetical protein